MNPLTLAILSDLHVGDEARAKDLCPHANDHAIDDNYLDVFTQFLAKNAITADYLICPGDVSNRAQPAEFELAATAVTKIASVLNVANDRILYVPGNHDVNWALMQERDPTAFGKQQRYAPLRFCKALTAILSAADGDLLEPPHFCVWEYEDLLTVGYNSSWHDDPNQSVHHGLIASSHLDELEQVLQALDLNNDRLKLFLVHHHPVQYSDPAPDDPDFSIMTNSERLLDILDRHGFDFLIHGHKHKPRFRTQILDTGLPLAILCAGSFSALLDARWVGQATNQFHIINVEGRDTTNGAVFGTVQSWGYIYSRGWVPSENHLGIPHRMAFGIYTNPRELATRLSNILAEIFASERYADWDALLAHDESLRYLPERRIIAALDTLREKLGFRIRGKTLDDIALLRIGE